MFQILANILSFIILPLLGFLFYVLGMNFQNGYRKKVIFLATIFLILAHESSQIILCNRYRYGGLEVLIDKNIYGSLIASLMAVKINFIWLGLLNIVLLIILDGLVLGYMQACGKNFWNSSFLIFLNAGLICSFFDKLVFRGSYDFILVFNEILIDIKDIYLFLSCILFLCEIVLNEKTNILITKE